jgi:hypothetical protein
MKRLPIEIPASDCEEDAITVLLDPAAVSLERAIEMVSE